MRVIHTRRFDGPVLEVAQSMDFGVEDFQSVFGVGAFAVHDFQRPDKGRSSWYGSQRPDQVDGISGILNKAIPVDVRLRQFVEIGACAAHSAVGGGILNLVEDEQDELFREGKQP